jgi:sialate O-acetylesterase
MKKLLSCIFLFAALTASADVTLPKIFGDNMVLQRDREIIVWGWASPKEKITVQLNKQTKTVTAGKDGKWKLSLAAESAGGPYQLVAKGKNTITLSNVLIGDVWVCSGQSNMEWPLRSSNNATEEISNAKNGMIRHFKVPNTISTEPKEDLAGGDWKVCSPETAGDFTAVGYFFARELTKELNVPIGLINTSWGGTHIETWTSREAFAGNEEFKSMIAGMPKLNLDSISKVKTDAMLDQIAKSQGKIPVAASETEAWKQANFDDSQWKTMKLPGLWEQRLGEFDGFVWFRKTVMVSAADAGKEASLELAMIDDSDETFVNGTKVGTTKQRYNEKRNYNIPAGVLKEGKNVIAVRVEDTGGGGGIFGDDASMKLTIAGNAHSLAGNWLYRIESISRTSSSIGPNSYPTLLFNAMLKPLIPFGIKGALWYQGEANAGRAYQYRKAFPLMINDWRKQWAQGDFPFYFVQLASFNADKGTSATGSTWAELREAQTMTLSLPNTGMAVTSDIGEAEDIHPRNKQDVGKRLAAVALSNTYGKTRVNGGPVYKSIEVKGDKVIVSFDNIGGGLITKDKYGYLKGFEIAGADKKFVYAKASIEGDKVVVFQNGVTEPVAVRYGWADEISDCNLYNAENFPAGPFRSDNWKGITEEEKFGFTVQ